MRDAPKLYLLQARSSVGAVAASSIFAASERTCVHVNVESISQTASPFRTLSVHALQGDADAAIALHQRDARAR